MQEVNSNTIEQFTLSQFKGLPEYHIKTSISYRENCCSYELPIQIYNNETEKEVIFVLKI